MVAKKRSLFTGEQWAGVEAAYDKERRLVTLSGWYDTSVGIAPETITLTQFLFDLGITVGDCRKALADIRPGPCASCGYPTGWTYFDGEAMVCIDFKACVARDRARDAEPVSDDDDDA